MTDKSFIFLANWKLNHSKKETLEFISLLLAKLKPDPGLKIILAPVVTVLDSAHEALKNSFIELCSQNVFYEQKGAYTGEYSAFHVAEVGCKYCLVGHFERRVLFKESNEIVAKKAQSCLMAGIIPICCIGENKQEYDQGLKEEVLHAQIIAILDHVQARPLYFAYEPVWAIGSNNALNFEHIEKTHLFIRELIVKKWGLSIAKECKILYGGSVSKENIGSLSLMPNIDGVLVGGASLQLESFLSMVDVLKANLRKKQC